MSIVLIDDKIIRTGHNKKQWDNGASSIVYKLKQKPTMRVKNEETYKLTDAEVSGPSWKKIIAFTLIWLQPTERFQFTKFLTISREKWYLSQHEHWSESATCSCHHDQEVQCIMTLNLDWLSDISQIFSCEFFFPSPTMLNLHLESNTFKFQGRVINFFSNKSCKE